MWKSIVQRSFDTFPSVTVEPAFHEVDDVDLEAAIRVVRSSLEDPVDSAPLSERLRQASTITVVLPDATRDLGPEVVEGVLAHVREHAYGAQMQFLVATGLHRAPTDDELRDCPHLAIAEESEFAVYAHNPQVARPVPSEPRPVINPATGDEVAIWLSPFVTEVDLVISLAKVELHQYAGFSGGYKSIAIGCAGARTIAAIHGLPILQMSGTQIGRLDRNPFQRLVNLVGAHAAPCFAVQEAKGGSGKAYASGEPSATLRLMAGRPDSTFHVDTDLFDGAIVHVSGPKAVNFYQASRAYTYLTLQEHPPLIPGAPVLLVADCPEGFGEGAGEIAFREALAEGLMALNREFESDAPTGRPSGGRQRAYMVARGCQRNPLHVLSPHLDPDDLPGSIEVHRTLDAAIEAMKNDAPMLDVDAGMEVLLTRNVFAALPRHRTDTEHVEETAEFRD